MKSDKKSLMSADILQKKSARIHMMGICGVGMAGLAYLLSKRGFKVSGCDNNAGRLSAWLMKNGIQVAENHNTDHISKSTDLLIITPAVSDSNEELCKAKAVRKPVFFRGEILPQVIRYGYSIAVAGTHGKTTTSTFIAQVLKSLKQDVTWCIGGESAPLGGVAGRSGSGKTPYIVVEADESDGTLQLYAPDIAVITNVEFDHMEHFASVKAFEDCFRTFAKNAEKVIYCADDRRAKSICRTVKDPVSYGFCSRADYSGSNIRQIKGKTSFGLSIRGKRAGIITIPVLGNHNVLNTLAAAAVLLEAGIPFGRLAKAFAKVRLPARRFDIIAERAGIKVISDYAHHPSEVRALIKMARQVHRKRIIAVYQPHRYTRTSALGADFPPAFEGIDKLALVPVYEASEQPVKGGRIADLYAHFRKKPNPIQQIVLSASLEQAWDWIKRELTQGDMLLVIGAGDVEKIAEWAKSYLEAGKQFVSEKIRISRTALAIRKLIKPDFVKTNVPVGRKTTLGTGGNADIWVDIDSIKDFQQILRFSAGEKIPFRLLGAGSNAIISDSGIKGITGRLTGNDFKRVTIDGNKITAGAGISLATLLNILTEHDLGGLEFLEGIPGTIGGAVRMNAGAWGKEIKDRIHSIRCLNKAGSECIFPRRKIEMKYRSCPTLKDRYLTEVELTAYPRSQAEISRDREEIRKKRGWMRGIRSAGSVFKNPKGDYAGKLIEKCGLKGFNVGGAYISTKHANIFVVGKSASSSDFMALMDIVKNEVQDRFKITLEPEVVGFE